MAEYRWFVDVSVEEDSCRTDIALAGRNLCPFLPPWSDNVISWDTLCFGKLSVLTGWNPNSLVEKLSRIYLGYIFSVLRISDDDFHYKVFYLGGKGVTEEEVLKFQKFPTLGNVQLALNKAQDDYDDGVRREAIKSLIEERLELTAKRNEINSEIDRINKSIEGLEDACRNRLS